MDYISDAIGVVVTYFETYITVMIESILGIFDMTMDDLTDALSGLELF